MNGWFGTVSQFAQEVSVLQNGEVRSAKAFIQPVSSTSPEHPFSPTPAGVRDDRRFLIIASPDAFSGCGHGVTVLCGDRKFQLLRCELMGGGSHWEGLLRLLPGDRHDA